jgi:hypothetical protein
MLGLSITAIAQRPFSECLEIYRRLKPKLNLDYLELAVGSRCNIHQLPDNEPLVLHNSCLYDGAIKLQFKLTDKSTWSRYREQIKNKNILLFSLHPPQKQESDWKSIYFLRYELEDYLGIPVCFEVMPYKNFWLYKSDFEERLCESTPLLVDISHVNIWEKSNQFKVQKWIRNLLPSAVAIHISHNNGIEDSHELIPRRAWFNELINDWSNSGLFVTYEALPEHFSQYDRAKRIIS